MGVFNGIEFVVGSCYVAGFYPMEFDVVGINPSNLKILGKVLEKDFAIFGKSRNGSRVLIVDNVSLEKACRLATDFNRG